MQLVYLLDVPLRLGFQLTDQSFDLLLIFVNLLLEALLLLGDLLDLGAVAHRYRLLFIQLLLQGVTLRLKSLIQELIFLFQRFDFNLVFLLLGFDVLRFQTQLLVRIFKALVLGNGDFQCFALCCERS